MFLSYRFRRTTVITVGLIAFLGGLGFARTDVGFSNELLITSLLVFLVTVLRLRLPAILGAIMLGFVLGWWRGQIVMNKLAPLQQIVGHHIVASVQADSDAIYNDRKELSFDASEIQLNDPFEADLIGRISVSGFGEPAVYKGDIVQIEGKVFASRGSKQLRMSYADIEVLGATSSIIDNSRRKFVAGMETALPEPLASFGLGLLIGQRNTLPDSATAQLAAVGLTHIIAVSGYNLTIIMRAVRKIFSKTSKYQITILSLVLMGLFLLMTGFSASIVRASIVCGLGLLAWYHGRVLKPALLIVLAAAITAGWNPLYIWSDIGWYLSFLAFFGVLILSPLLNQRLFGSKKPKVFTSLISECLCALVMTVPLVMYIFSQISLVALVANMFVVPLVPLAMLFALVAGMAGIITPILSGVFAIPAKILLTYMLDITQVLSRIPHALAHRQLSLYSMLFVYGCVGLFVIVLWRKTKINRDTITETISGDIT